jgi:hypothetical protein
MGKLGFQADDIRMEISVGGKKENTGTISWACRRAISAGFRGIVGEEVERRRYVDGEKDGW